MSKSIFIRFLIVLIMVKNFAVENVLGVSQEPPKIKIESSPWLGNGTIQKDKILKLECTALYSIYWDFMPSEFTVFHCNSSVSTNEDNQFVVSEKLEIHYLEPRYGWDTDLSYGRTGNYTCKSTSNSTLSTSAFVYSKDNARIFNSPLMHSTFSKLINESEWTIPCPANLENSYLNVSLYFVPEQLVNSTNETFYTVLYPHNSSTRYDSRYGFLLNKTIFQRPSGHYICQASVLANPHETEKSVMNLSQYNVYPKGAYVIYTNKQEIVVTCESDEEVYINTENSFRLTNLLPPQKYKTDSFNWSVTNVLKETANGRTDGHREGEISCRIKSSDRILHVWKHDGSKAVTNVSIEVWEPYYGGSHITQHLQQSLPVGTIQFQNPTEKSMVIKSTHCNIRTKCNWAFKYFDMLHDTEVEIRETPGESERIIYPYHYGINVRASSVFKCEVESNYTTMIEIISDLQGYGLAERPKYIDNWETNRTSDHRLNFTIEYKMDIYSGDTVSFVCRAAMHFYRRGFRFKILYKNQTHLFIKGKHVDYVEDSLLHSIVTEGISIEVTKDIVLVECEANLSNSTIWEFSTVSLPDITDLQIWNATSNMECEEGYDKPKIVLKRILGYYPTSYGNTMKPANHIVNDADIIIDSGLEGFWLVCIAAYPVKWYFNGQIYWSWWYWNDRNRNMDEFGNSTNVDEDTLHHCFIERAEFHSYNYRYYTSGTGEYRCENLHDPNIYSSGYVYTSGMDNLLIGNGRHNVIKVDMKNPEVLFPCRVTNPRISVYLYYHEKKGKYKLLTKDKYINYNPKKGFLLATESLNFSSVYICTISTNSSQRNKNSIYFTLKINETDNTISQTNSFQPEFTLPSEVKAGFFFVFLLFTSSVVFQLVFLKKQITFHQLHRAMAGNHINLESNSAAVFNEFEGNNAISNTNSQTHLLPL